MKRSHGRHMNAGYSRYLLFSVFLLTAALSVSACGRSLAEADRVSDVAAETEEIRETEVSVEGPEEVDGSETETKREEKQKTPSPAAGGNLSIEEIVYSFESDFIEVTEYAGDAYVVINDNEPFFTKSDLPTESFEYYSDLDELGRCGIACANIGQDIMPTEKRESIGQVKPSGWQTVKYDNVDGKYLYNRCHLIGYQLSAENANEKNLITGTRYLNVTGMLPFENMVADYVKETGNHVLYRVNPLYEEEDLLAYGVLMEAWSVEDDGDGICFNVFAYNVQPNIVIDYANGDSYYDENAFAAKESGQTGEDGGYMQEAAEEPKQSVEVKDYILNTNSKIFHDPYCDSVDRMSEKNKQPYSGNREDIIEMGYDPCERCNP